MVICLTDICHTCRDDGPACEGPLRRPSMNLRRCSGDTEWTRLPPAPAGACACHPLWSRKRQCRRTTQVSNWIDRGLALSAIGSGHCRRALVVQSGSPRPRHEISTAVEAATARQVAVVSRLMHISCSIQQETRSAERHIRAWRPRTLAIDLNGVDYSWKLTGVLGRRAESERLRLVRWYSTTGQHDRVSRLHPRPLRLACSPDPAARGTDQRIRHVADGNRCDRGWRWHDHIPARPVASHRPHR